MALFGDLDASAIGDDAEPYGLLTSALDSKATTLIARARRGEAAEHLRNRRETHCLFKI